MRPISKLLLGALVLLALLGFIDATYLTAEHLRGVVPPCTVVSGCDTVLTSRYASFIGLPVAGFGMLYYGALLIMLIIYIDTGSRRIFRWACWLTLIGLSGSIYFLVLQVFILKAYCFYCLMSAGISITLFILGIVGLLSSRPYEQMSMVERAE